MRRLHYGWIVVACTALAIFVAAGVRSAAGVFLLPMEADLGIPRSAVSLAVSLGLLVYGLSAPISGSLIDRFGPRRVASAGLLLIAAGMVTSANATSAWQLHAFFGVLTGVGTGVVGGVLGATIASRWFVRHRGLVVGIFGAAVSAGQLVFIPVLASLTVRLGWRPTSLWMAMAAGLLLLPVSSLLRNDPADKGIAPYGVVETTPLPGPDPGVMRKAVRTPDFWLLVGTFGICGLTSNGIIGTHFIAHAVEHGFAETVAAGALAVMGAFNFVGTIASGWLSDRFDPRRLLLMYYGLRGVSLFLIPMVHGQLGLMAFALLFGLDYVATVPPTVALVSDTFGRQNVGTVYGWVFAAHQAGAALSAWGGGVIRERWGDYVPAFLTAGVAAVIAGIAILWVKRSTRPALHAA
jgi:MFS family permease